MREGETNLVSRLANDENSKKGEAVIVVAGNSEALLVSDDLDSILRPLLAELPLKQAVKLAVAISGESKNQVYSRALELGKS